jgi:hypothetical protein
VTRSGLGITIQTSFQWASWIPFTCGLIFCNRMQECGSVLSINMSYLFVITVVDLYQKFFFKFFLNILIYFVIKGCVFCSFPQKFHLCFYSISLVSSVSGFHFCTVRLALLMCICSLVYFRSVQGFGTCFMIPICKNSANLCIILFSLHVTASQAIAHVCLLLIFN